MCAILIKAKTVKLDQDGSLPEVKGSVGCSQTSSGIWSSWGESCSSSGAYEVLKINRKVTEKKVGLPEPYQQVLL